MIGVIVGSARCSRDTRPSSEIPADAVDRVGVRGRRHHPVRRAVGLLPAVRGIDDGQTPGKRLLRLRAVRDGGYSVGFSASAVRNLMRIVDLQPAVHLSGRNHRVALSKSGKRLGDIVAGTIVVRESLVQQPVRAAALDREMPLAPATAQLTDAEFHLLERWAERRGITRRPSAAASSSRRSRHVSATRCPPTKGRARARCSLRL